MRGYSPSSRMGLGRGPSAAAVYLDEVLVAGTGFRTRSGSGHVAVIIRLKPKSSSDPLGFIALGG